MAKLKLPFELENPSSNEYVTQGSQIGWDGQPLTTKINAGSDAKSTVGNINATSIESKVNAIIDVLQRFIQGAVFHSGTPFVSPEELSTSLELLRYTYSSLTPAICGQAICGQTICGTI